MSLRELVETLAMLKEKLAYDEYALIVGRIEYVLFGVHGLSAELTRISRRKRNTQQQDNG